MTERFHPPTSFKDSVYQQFDIPNKQRIILASGTIDSSRYINSKPFFPKSAQEIYKLMKLNKQMNDPVNHPPHYKQHPSGIECIQITEHMGFNLGNAIKYIWRADLKNDAIEDLRKARWYIDREIQKRVPK